MDALRLDTWTRRRFGLALGGGMASLSWLSTLLDAEAKKKRKKRKRKKKKRCKPNPPESACTKNKNCCPKKTKYVCGTSHGSGTDTCCGLVGAACSSTLNCCIENCCVDSVCVEGLCM